MQDRAAGVHVRGLRELAMCVRVLVGRRFSVSFGGQLLQVQEILLLCRHMFAELH